MAELPPSMTPPLCGPPRPRERGERPLLVLLHGYGADERDLFGLVAVPAPGVRRRRRPRAARAAVARARVLVVPDRGPRQP